MVAILRDRKPWVDVAQTLNMTVAGIVAHQSALKDGELLKIPQYHFWEGCFVLDYVPLWGIRSSNVFKDYSRRCPY